MFGYFYNFFDTLPGTSVPYICLFERSARRAQGRAQRQTSPRELSPRRFVLPYLKLEGHTSRL